MGLFSELRRRQVFKVGAAYAVVGWLVVQAAALLCETYVAPPWVMQTFVALVILGFPIALVLAWAFEISPAGVRRSRTSAAGAPVASHGSIVGYVVTAALAGAIGAGAFWFLTSDRDAEWLRDVAIPEIESHIATGDWYAAFSATQGVQARLGDVPELEQIWPRMSWLTTIDSEPRGATVSIRPYNSEDDAWQELGRTPLDNIRFPRGLSRLKLELDGYLPLFRTAGGGYEARELRPGADPVTSPGNIGPEIYKLDTRATLPEGKVRVSGWTEVIAGQQARFSDYFLDRAEVTNAQYQEFISAGGYERPELWDPIIQNGQTLAFEDAMRLFVDAAGRPGPAAWTGGMPVGQDEFPVAGVSWYEAAAYARWAGQELPTAYHWRRARALAFTPWLMAESNVAGTGTRSVRSSRAMSYVGAYDLAGNVREWTATVDGDTSVIAGGSWDDAPFVAFQSLTASAPRIDRSPANGFRLAIIRDPAETRTLASTPLNVSRPGRDPLKLKPVSAEVFAAYSSFFSYEHSPLNATIEEEKESRLWTRQRVTFDSPYSDEREVLYLFLPASGVPPYQTVFFWPGALAYVVDSLDDELLPVDFIIQSGRALAIPVYAGTYEHRNDRGPPFAPNSPISYRDNMVEGVIDLRRSLDYLETRADIDPDAMGYFGFSQGAVQAPIVLAWEPRIKVAIGTVGFIPPQNLEPPADPLHALPRVTQPFLLLSGEFDSTAQLPNARYYFELLGTPATDKKHVITPGGHFVPREQLVRETLDWLDRYLGRPRELQSRR